MRLAEVEEIAPADSVGADRGLRFRAAGVVVGALGAVFERGQRAHAAERGRTDVVGGLLSLVGRLSQPEHNW